MLFSNLVIMKVCNFRYYELLYLLICIKHNICFSNKNLIKYLRNLHRIKNSQLRAIYVEIFVFRVRNLRQIEFFFDKQFFIFYFFVYIEYCYKIAIYNVDDINTNVFNKH